MKLELKINENGELESGTSSGTAYRSRRAGFSKFTIKSGKYRPSTRSARDLWVSKQV